MQTALFLIPLAAVLVVALVLNYRDTRNTFNFLTADEVAPTTWADRALDAAAASRPNLTVVPDGFTCLGCYEADALPDSVWCAVCSERVANFPAEPIERGPIS